MPSNTKLQAECSGDVDQPVAELEQPPRLQPDGASLTDTVTDFHCPVCDDQQLQVATLDATQACCCPECFGLLVDSQSLGQLISYRRAHYDGPDDTPTLMDQQALAQQIYCPTCREFMQTHPYYGPGNLVINSCSTCQLNWLDAGELSGIIRAPGRR